MGLAPAFRIEANSQDVTDTIRQRFHSLTITDEAGVQSDVLQLVLVDDPNQPIEVPDDGSELEVWIGYDDSAVKFGLFVVDDVTLSGPPDKVTIRAHASPHTISRAGKKSMQTQKTRSWPEGTTLGDMVKTIASEHELEARVVDELATIALPHTDQVDESDINLLTRTARTYQALVKPADGKLIMVKRGQSTTVRGGAIGPVDITRNQATTWTVNITKKKRVASVVATYRDEAAAADMEVTAGQGEPVKRLRNTYKDEAEAKEAAQAELEQSQRSGSTLQLSLPGRTDLVAEGRLNLIGFRPRVNGEWLLTRVTHTINSNGYSCRCDGEVPNG